MHKAESVLIIEDDRECVEDLKTGLAGRCQIDAIIVEPGFDANRLQELTPDVVILDVSMPVTGEVVYQQLRRINQGCAVIVWTLLPRTSERVRWFTERGIQVVAKEDKDMGLSALRALLERFAFNDPKDLAALVIDDELRNRKDYEQLLEKCGVGSITAVSSVEEGRAQIQLASRQYAVIVLDTYFEHSDGAILADGVSFATELTSSPISQYSQVFLISARPSRYEFDVYKEQDRIRKIPLDLSVSLLEKELGRVLKRGQFYRHN